MARGGCMIALALVLVARAAAAAVSAGARLEPSTVGVGEPSDLAVVVQGTQQSSAPRVPTVDGLRVEYVGPETQVSIVNGQITSSVTHHFTVTPQREGTFSFGPITLEAEGRTVSAGVVTLRVAPGGGAARAGDQGLTVVLSTPRGSVYLNERVPLTAQLRVGEVRVSDVSYPRIEGDGFSVEPFPEPAQRQEQTAAGTVQVIDFRTAFVPVRAGPLALGPAVVPVVVVKQQAHRRLLFGGATRQQMEVRSDPLSLDVLPLPAEGRPADFAGAVGRFTLAVTAKPVDPAAGDPVTLTFTVRGNGNLAGATPAGVAASDAYRVYPVQPATQQPQVTGGGVVNRVFEQVVIPQRAGAQTLPAQRFSFFDPDARAYRTVSQPPIALAVRPAPQGAATPQIVGAPTAGRTPEASAPLGRDIVSIKDAPGVLVPVGAARWRSAGFWLLQLLPLLLLVGVTAWDRRRRRLGDDPRFARFTRAGRAAHRGLAAARAALAGGDPAGCYDGIARTVSEYLGAKLDLPPGSVTADHAGARLRAAGVGDGVVDDIRTLYATCETARFAPGGRMGTEAERALERAEALIRACERERRLGRMMGAAALALVLGAAVACAGRAVAADTPEALFYRGNALYGEGKFTDAAAAYEAARAGGVTSAALEYNLGNARLRAGDVGRAVQAYERAHRLAPRDPDLLANLGFARPAGTESRTPWWLVALFPLARRWTASELVTAGAVAWWASCLLLVAARLVPAAARGLRAAAVVTGLALVVVATSAGWRLATVELRPTGVVIAPDPVTVRFEPTATGTAHFEAPPGSVLRLLGERGEWVQVERPDGLRGWVPQGAMGPL